MAVLRGKGLGLEIALGERDFEEALAELQSKLGERPGFYSGTQATAAVGRESLSEEQLARLRTLLSANGITLEGVTAAPDAGEELARRRALRPKRELQLSDAARSLVPDFEGARKDIAIRRSRGESSVRRLVPAPEPAAVEIPPVAPATLYHVGTLRGGQALHNVGNIVVIGDVNPGAELIAGGDIAVFGSLRGVAHAGAQGDAGARVYAVDLSPTQLRIATLIAADAGARGARKEPEAACVQNERITIVPLVSAERFAKETKEKVE
ncbi:MAG TPA: septum site-determining protein MinC [Candidatus Rubrimentiphilum sp.]|nr:septum site-determining protein MinC [Candidatus Rubrimentiphilum sp.]